MLTTLLGLLVTSAGFWGMKLWWNDFLYVLRGLGPVCLIFGGLAAVIIGISNLKFGTNEERLTKELKK